MKNKLKKLLKIDRIVLISIAITHIAGLIFVNLLNLIVINKYNQSTPIYDILFIIDNILLLASIVIITLIYPIYLLVTNIIAFFITQKYRRVFSLIGYLIVAGICGFAYYFYYSIDDVYIYKILTACVILVFFILPSIIHIIHHNLDSKLLTE